VYVVVALILCIYVCICLRCAEEVIRAGAELRRDIPGIPILSLPDVEADSPREKRNVELCVCEWYI